MITPREMANLLSRAVEVADDSGTATGGSTTTLVDTRKHWLADWSGAVAHIFRNGIEYEVNITSNTTTELTLAQTLPFAVGAGVAYSLRHKPTLADISDRSPRLLGIIDSLTKWGGTALTGRDISTDLAKLDLALTALRDAITAAAPDNKTLNDLYTKLHTLLYSNLEPVIDDPGFETGSEVHWEFNYTTGGSYSVQSTEKYEGSYALQVSPAANGYLRGIAYGDYIPLTSKQRVKVAAALKADANISYSYLIAEFYDANLAVLDTRYSMDLGNNYDWKEVEVPIGSDPPEGACFYRIGFDFRSGGTAGTAYCDKFSVPHPLKGAGRRTLTDLYGYLATEATLTAQLNITLSALRDAICAIAPNNKTLNDLHARLAETLTRDISDEAGRILGQITDGTSAISPAAFGSGTHPRNIINWGGIALTGRDISSDIARLDIALSAFRDAICAAAPNAKTLNDVYTRILDVQQNVYSQLIGADETIAQSITLDVSGRTLLDIYGKADTATPFGLDCSNDNTNWITDYLTWAAVTEVKETHTNAFRYLRLKSNAAGGAGNLISLYLTAAR